jgi:hypothetical protein
MIGFEPYSLTGAHNPMLKRSFNTVMGRGEFTASEPMKEV